MSARLVQDIPLERIAVRDRLRPADPAYVETLAASIVSRSEQGLDGLIHPIEVRPIAGDRFELVAGYHRLAAYQRLALPAIAAQVTDLTPAQARLSEVEENLIRRDLDALDRAVFLAEWKRLYEELHPETEWIARRQKDKQKQSVAKLATVRAARYSKEAAERTGLSERTIRRASLLYAELGPALIEILRKTPVAGNAAQLRALVRLAPDARQACAGAFQAGARSVREALAHCGLGTSPTVEITAEEAQVRKFIALWSEMPAAARRRALAFAGCGPATIDKIVNPRSSRQQAAPEGGTKH